MKLTATIRQLDKWNAALMHKFGFVLLRYALAVIFIWFGILKPLEQALRACLEVVIWAANARFQALISAISSPIALLWPRK